MGRIYFDAHKQKIFKNKHEQKQDGLNLFDGDSDSFSSDFHVERRKEIGIKEQEQRQPPPQQLQDDIYAFDATQYLVTDEKKKMYLADRRIKRKRYKEYLAKKKKAYKKYLRHKQRENGNDNGGPLINNLYFFI